MSNQEKLDKCAALSGLASKTSHSNNNNNNTSLSNSNKNNSNTGEQPKTKRQKIEKIKKNNSKEATSTVTSSSTTTSSSSSSSSLSLSLSSKINILQPPDILDTGGDGGGGVGGVGHLQLQQHLQNKQHCSSLNSSSHSLATTHSSSSNNSPNSTPSNSRTTSLTQLLNVQNALVHILPANETSPRSSTNSLTDIRRTPNSSNSSSSSSNSSSSSSSSSSSCTGSSNIIVQLSTDEVDRIVVNNTMPDLLPINENVSNLQKDCISRSIETPAITISTSELIAAENMREFEDSLIKQCLCGVSERTLQKPFQSHYSFDAFGQKRIAALSEWPTNKLLQFLSNLQLLFDIYLKQNSKGFICVTIMDVCNAIIRNERKLIDEIIVLSGYNNSYVQFLAARVLSSFLVIAKQELDDVWLKKLVDNLFDNERLDDSAIKRIHFSLDIIKRIVEWKDIDLHPLEDEIVDQRSNAGITTNVNRRDSNIMEQNHSHNNVLPNNDHDHDHDRDQDHDHGLLDSLSYMHFQPQQPTLENNYFAAHYLENEQQPDNMANQSLYHQRHQVSNQTNQHHSHSQSQTSQHHQQQHSQHHQHHQQHQHQHHHEDADIEDLDEEDDEEVDHEQEDDDDEEDEEDDLDDVNEAAILQNAARHSQSLAQLQHHYGNYNNYSSSFHQQTQHHSHPHSSPAPPNPPSHNHHHHHSQQSSDAINQVSTQYAAAGGHQQNPVSNVLGCNIVPLTDSESFDTTHLKCVTIKILEDGWPSLVRKMSTLISNHLDAEDAENCILNFLQLWENIISVKANLSVVKTLPFYAQLDKFEKLLNQNLCCTVYKQMLCLFNEALCYGSTLALQDILPDETCQLAHQIVRHVKDFRILEFLPRRHPENIVSLLGFKRKPVIFAPNSLQSQPLSIRQSQQHDEILEMDKTILQKMVLLVLKSIAVSVKEIRSDSSDSSIDSTDYDAFQDMVLIERSIRDVLRKLENFIKHTLEFHPDCHFSKILIHLFDDQDDHLIEAMVCTLDVTSGISFRNNAFPELVAMLNPVYTFLEFLKMISNSSDLLLDLLVSNETCFLLYLLRFLKYIRMNWQMFVQSCHDFGMGSSVLDEAMSVLIRLRLQISRLVSRQLYPYEISPVLRLLESCESLYEGNELA